MTLGERDRREDGEPGASARPAKPLPSPADARKRLLELRLKAGRDAPAAPPKTRDGGALSAPVASHAQEALWFIERLLGPSDLYHVTKAVRLRGRLDEAALERSLSALIERHPCLRTGFEERDGKPVPFVSAPSPAKLATARAGGNTAEERRLSTLRLMEAEAMRPFDLARPPLIRGLLIRVGPEDHVFLLVAHHIVTDGWSMGIIAREIGELYGAFSAGGVPALPPLGADFAGHAVSQRLRIASDSGARDLDYWRAQLQGLEPLDLPTDPQLADGARYEGRTETAVIPVDLAQALRSLAQRSGATLFMALLAAYQALLMRLSGQHDFAVGVPVAGRDGTALEGVVGYFVNALAVRTDLSGSPGFLTLLARTRRTVLDALEHQQTPFEQLVHELAPDRDPDRNPLFDVMFNYTEGLRGRFLLPGLECTSETVPRMPSKFAMTLYAEAQGDGVELRLAYRGDRFSQARAAAMLAQYVALIEQVVAQPEAPVGAHSLVTDQTRALLPDPAAEISAPPQVPVPARIAIREGDRQLGYRDLVAGALDLASLLRARGVARGDVVAIQMPRSAALVEAMLAALMSGAALMVVDPALPRERRLVMLREARARLVCVSDAAGACAEPPYPGVEALRVDEGRAAAGSAPEPSEAAEVDGNDPAYLFFTSGSTGQPKAILGRHKSLSHFLDWQRAQYRIGADDRVSQLIGLSFDPLLRDVFLPLTSGGTLCIPGEDDFADPIGWLMREKVTVVHSTPAVVQSWLAARPADAELPDLRWLFLSGEPLTDSLVQRWRRGPGRRTRLVNFYGPTETTMIRCAYEIPEDVQPGIQPVGLPLPHSQALVLNPAGGLCGIGEPGEIVLRTPFSTLGYLNLPDENARRFRRNPFRDDDADLVYFTGDRGRYRPDGVLEICGRLDDQVKIRGVRVEPGEVAAVLSRHEGVDECVVVARPDPRGETALAAYFVAGGPTAPGASELRAYLKRHLSAALVPASFVRLDSLPLLPNGKVDRRALPAPDWGASAAGYAAPRSEIERTLASIWEGLLGVERVGLDDDFFELGGHSMLAIRVLAEVDRRLGRQLRMAAFFEAPTIRQFAALLGSDATDGKGCVVTVQKGDGSRPLFFVSGWGAQLIVLKELAKGLDAGQSLHVLDTAAFDPDAIRAAGQALTIEWVAARMVEDMRRVQATGPYRLAGYSMGGKIVHEIAQQLVRSGERVALLALLDSRAPGYPRRRSAPVRVFLHLRKALAMPPSEMARYIAGRARWMVRHMMPRERALFEDGEVEHTALTLAMERAARAMHAAWSVYQPRFYPGRLTMIRAEGTPEKVGEIHDDPTLGWAALSGEGVELRSMQCAHNHMLLAPHAEDLAKILAQLIADEGPASAARRQRESADCHA
ncbi:amino acid adenylation domain-containing protein [Burkholderiaceae bacterium FT117]|uniref:non-ribosomal peptide synthetase n=1 Tax=Zeimonas sediminis TaxID=2944268 RepID=UPI002342D543|nr:amino acid adenylation domain-containing protein [Zeimonas sediminis]MCM5570800.1 amino acid adenylation domain-containing protein [Zeimonas sediminis]